jgi:two-component sensor histidine kinase
MFLLGIILSELFINSIKYAFNQDYEDGYIEISLSKDEDKLYFVYYQSQNGNIEIEKIVQSQSLGLRLVKLIVKQLDGTFEVAQDNGLIFTIEFHI